jgi:hypothetical protein
MAQITDAEQQHVDDHLLFAVRVIESTDETEPKRKGHMSATSVASVFALVVLATRRFPFTSTDRFSSSIAKPELRSCRLYTSCRPRRSQTPRRLLPQILGLSGFDNT